LFEQLGVTDTAVTNGFNPIGRGGLIWLHERPADLTTSADGAAKVVAAAKLAAGQIGRPWRETNFLLLRRGPYVIASGLDEPALAAEPRGLHGRFVNLFDAELRVRNDLSITPGSRWFLLDLDAVHTGKPHLLASACKALLKASAPDELRFTVEGVGETQAILLLESPKAPQAVTLDGKEVTATEYSESGHLLWIHLANDAAPHELALHY